MKTLEDKPDTTAFGMKDQHPQPKRFTVRVPSTAARETPNKRQIGLPRGAMQLPIREDGDGLAIPSSTTEVAVGVYCGPHPDGRHRVKRSDKRYLVAGAVYDHLGDQAEPGKSCWCATPRLTSPGFDASKPETKTSILHVENSSALVRVVGIFTPHVKNTDAKPNAATVAVAQDVPVQPGLDLPGVCDAGTSSRKKRPTPAVNDRVASEFERVGQAVRSGLDPDVKLAFVAAYLQLSRATVYRHIAKGTGKFPPGTVRAGGRFWRYSEIEAYRMYAASVSGDVPGDEQ